MYRRLLLFGIAASCLIFVLAIGTSMWGIHHGLIEGPTGVVDFGGIEILAFTELEYLPNQPLRGYYVVWLRVTSDCWSSSGSQRPIPCAYRLVWIDTPPSAVFLR